MNSINFGKIVNHTEEHGVKNSFQSSSALVHVPWYLLVNEYYEPNKCVNRVRLILSDKPYYNRH